MIEQIGIGILITIIGAPLLWILKTVLGAPILRILKKSYRAIVNKCRKLKAKAAKSPHQSGDNSKLKAEVRDDSHQYNENYRKRYGALEDSRVKSQAPMSLDNVSVTVESLWKDEVSKYQSPEGIERVLREESESYFGSSPSKDGISVANDEQYLMVLGSLGVGKSTFLRKVGFEASKGKDGGFEHECIPVFLELKSLTKDSIDVKALITQEFKICGYPDPKRNAMAALKSGKLLILIDGLDEVLTIDIDNAVCEIWNFINQYRQNRFIVSCRQVVNIGEFTQFTNVKVADFDDLQVQAYIRNWFASTPNPHQLDEGMRTAEQCWEALNVEEHQAIKELTQNPLLLAMLCMVYDDGQDFPRNRTDFYERAFNIFLKKWTIEKFVRPDSLVSQYLDISTVKKIPSEIASRNFKADRFLFSRDELVNQIQEFYQENANTPLTFDAFKILDTILVDQGLFVERFKDFYSFPHLTFQEYLTASYFIGDAGSIQVLVTEYLHDKQWRGIFLFAVELMPESDSLLLEMEAEVSKSINTDGLKALFRWAKRITHTSDDLYSGTAKRAFVVRQYFSLRLLNKIYEEVTNFVNRDRKTDPDPSLDQDLNFYRELTEDYSLKDNLYLDFDEVPNLSFYHEGRVDAELLDVCGYSEEDLCLYLNQNLISYRDLSFFLYLYENLNIDLLPDPDFNFYQDLYRYTDADFYPLVYPKFGDGFDLELRKRITLVQLIEQAKIFKGVDLQRLIHRFNDQRQFIKAASEGESVKPPNESIHNIWISVLGITDDMLAIPLEEMENYLQYLRAVDLIVECKETAGRVSPEIWKGIEDRLLSWDAEEIGI